MPILFELPGKKFIKETSRLIYNFLWNKTDRMKRNTYTLIGDNLDGGIRKIDLESRLQALKAIWISWLLTTNHIERITRWLLQKGEN